METQSDEVPAAERWDWWREKLHQTLGPVAVQRYQDTEFRFTGRRLHLGDVQVTELSHPSVRFHRSTRLIRREDPEQLLLNLNLRGHTSAVMTGREGYVHQTGDFMLSDTSRPSHTWMSEDDDSYLHLLVQVPRTVVPLPPNAVDRLLTLPLPGREGIGALLSNYLTGLVSSGHQYKPADIARLSTITVDLLTAMFAHHLDATTSTPYETQQRVLQIRIRDFIQQHLGNPQLSPTMIAAAHGISTRYLYKLFRDQDEVDNSIREVAPQDDLALMRHACRSA